MIRVFTGAVAAGARFDAGFNEGLRTAIIYAALVNAKTLHPSYSFVDGIITNNPERVAAKLQTVQRTGSTIVHNERTFVHKQ